MQVDSEPDTMFSDYQNYGTYGPNLGDQNYGTYGANLENQNYGTYGPNLSGFKKRSNKLPFIFGLGK